MQPDRNSPPFDVRTLVRPELANLEEYTPIVPFEVLSRRLGIPAARIVKLDANENPYGPVPAVTEALADYNFYHIYPDPQQTELREALADFVGVAAAHILPTHGADEMLDYLCRLFLQPGDAIIDCPPTFGMYSFDAQLGGGKVIEVWRGADFAVDVAAIKQAVHGAAEQQPAEWPPGRSLRPVAAVLVRSALAPQRSAHGSPERVRRRPLLRRSTADNSAPQAASDRQVHTLTPG